MHNISVTYEVVVEKELFIDLDKVIEAVLNDLKEDSDDFGLFDISCQFGDNVEHYLNKLGIIDESIELGNYTLDEIYDKFMERVEETHPEFSTEDGIEIE